MAKNRGKRKVSNSDQVEVEMEKSEVNPESITEEEGEISEVDQLTTEIEEHKDKYLRLYSEFDNFRRRTAKEKMELTKTATEELAVSLLSVVDDFERSLKAFENEQNSTFKEGVELVYQKLVKILEQRGVKAMEIKGGDHFDAEVHEAISQIPAPNKKLVGKIVDVVEKGYFLNDKVVRFAKVVTGA